MTDQTEPRLTPQEAIDKLNAIAADDDPEMAHSLADGIIMDALPPLVADAYDRVVNRTNGWWYA